VEAVCGNEIMRGTAVGSAYLDSNPTIALVYPARQGAKVDVSGVGILLAAVGSFLGWQGTHAPPARRAEALVGC
jgi:hypothetical protein